MLPSLRLAPLGRGAQCEAPRREPGRADRRPADGACHPPVGYRCRPFVNRRASAVSQLRARFGKGRAVGRRILMSKLAPTLRILGGRIRLLGVLVGASTLRNGRAHLSSQRSGLTRSKVSPSATPISRSAGCAGELASTGSAQTCVKWPPPLGMRLTATKNSARPTNPSCNRTTK